MTNDDYHYDIVKIDKNEKKISRNFPYYYQKNLTVTSFINGKWSKARKNIISSH